MEKDLRLKTIVRTKFTKVSTISTSLNVEDKVQYASDGGHPVFQSTIRAIDPSRLTIVLSDNSELKATDRVLRTEKRVYLQVDEYDLNTESSLPP
mmetsp:Transcript_9634/g.22520  ORF Transcript_9634/g.22520 Transcript_9634/m.22520 type:complete len:95 (+) Transcript_9634:2291-2575(+)